jgi:hypothetical protein
MEHWIQDQIDKLVGQIAECDEYLDRRLRGVDRYEPGPRAEECAYLAQAKKELLRALVTLVEHKRGNDGEVQRQMRSQ